MELENNIKSCLSRCGLSLPKKTLADLRSAIESLIMAEKQFKPAYQRIKSRGRELDKKGVSKFVQDELERLQLAINVHPRTLNELLKALGSIGDKEVQSNRDSANKCAEYPRYSSEEEMVMWATLTNSTSFLKKAIPIAIKNISENGSIIKANRKSSCRYIKSLVELYRQIVLPENSHATFSSTPAGDLYNFVSGMIVVIDPKQSDPEKGLRMALQNVIKGLDASSPPNKKG